MAFHVLQMEMQALPRHFLTAYRACSFRFQGTCRLVTATTAVARGMVVMRVATALHVLSLRWYARTESIRKRTRRAPARASFSEQVLAGSAPLR